MWMLVMFDLLADTKLQRKAATDFRNFLLDQGFERSQFSVYARFVNGKEAFRVRVNKIERNIPAMGDIQNDVTRYRKCFCKIRNISGDPEFNRSEFEMTGSSLTLPVNPLVFGYASRYALPPG